MTRCIDVLIGEKTDLVAVASALAAVYGLNQNEVRVEHENSVSDHVGDLKIYALISESDGEFPVLLSIFLRDPDLRYAPLEVAIRVNSTTGHPCLVPIEDEEGLETAGGTLMNLVTSPSELSRVLVRDRMGSDGRTQYFLVKGAE